VTETRAIGEILRDAAAGELANALGESRAPYDLIGAADRLFATLEKQEVPCVLVGGIAMLQYVEGRNTRDIDLIVEPERLSRIPELVVAERDRDFARAHFDGIQVDLLFTANPVFELVMKRHTGTRKFADRAVRIATPQGMLILKLYALPSLYRQGEAVRAAIYEADVTGLLQLPDVEAPLALDALRVHLLPTDLAELERIVDDIRGRAGRFRPA